MRKRYFALFLAVAMLFSVAHASMPVHAFYVSADTLEVQTMATHQDAQSNRLIVGTSGWVDFASLNALSVESISSDIHVLQFSTAQAAQRARDLLIGMQNVAWVEFDLLTPPIDDEVRIIEAAEYTSGFVSWGAITIGAAAYHDFLREAGRAQNSIIVAVLDTGVDATHPILSGRVLPGWNFVNNNEDTHDPRGHGTFVAGIIADITRGFDVHILPVTVLGTDGTGSPADIARGIRWAVESGAQVINMSLGGSRSTVIDETVLWATAMGATVVVSAGNESVHANLRSPAAADTAFTVSSINNNNLPAASTGWGSVVNIAAPGVDVQSAYLNGANAFASGTSYAAPHVSAAVALYKIANPNISPAAVKRNFVGYVEIPSGWDSDRHGAGILNMERAIPGAVQQPRPTPAPTPRPMPTPMPPAPTPIPMPTPVPLAHTYDTQTGINSAGVNWTYVGNFYNGQRHGHGRVDFDSGAWYEGEWRNNQYSGIGKMTVATGYTYTGEWSNSLLNGLGFSVRPNGDMWVGEWRDGNLNGRAIFIPANPNSQMSVGLWSNGSFDGTPAPPSGATTGTLNWSNGSYSGHVWNDSAHGWGLRRWDSGAWYYGEWRNGVANGWGVTRYSDGRIQAGLWSNHQQDGRGITIWENGNIRITDWVNGEQGRHVIETGINNAGIAWIYTGEQSNGNWHGQGRMQWANGQWYEGSWNNGWRHGRGEYFWSSGAIHVGNWVNGEITGRGTRTFADGGIRSGDWVNGQLNGYGTETGINDEGEAWIYVGNIANGRWQGWGRIEWSGGSWYEGDWLAGNRNGFGTMFWRSSGSTHVGYFLNGQPHGQGTRTFADGTTQTGRWENGNFVG